MPGQDIDAVYQAHRQHAESVTGLAPQPWGERAFHAVMLGYRFLIAAEAYSPSATTNKRRRRRPAGPRP